MWILLVDMRENNGSVVMIQDENNQAAQYRSLDIIREEMRGHILSNFPMIALNIDTLEVEEI